MTGTNPRAHGSGHRRWAAAALSTFVALAGSGLGEAYRFRDSRGGPWSTVERHATVPAEHALRWSPGVWGPGDTLVFVVAPDPDFEVLFDSPEGVIPYFERALAAWSDIPTADIELRVDGVAEGNQILPTLYANPEDGGHSGARRWDRFHSGMWERFSCDIGLNSWYARPIPDDIEPEEVEDWREGQRERVVATLVHDVGHCIGLEDAGALSSVHRWVWDSEWAQIHPRDPAMSRGRGQESPDQLAADDVAGASLLRPAPGFLIATGTISGTLNLDGEPALYAQVWALPVGSDPLRDRIGVFSDHKGVFRIEGLEPGEYALWVQPQHFWHWGIAEDSPRDLDETILGRPVYVRAGRNTRGIEIPVRQGRVPRPRPDAFVIKPDSPAPASIVGSWGNPCSGVRVRAEERPYLADGPDARPERRIGDARWYTTALTLEWSGAREDVIVDWAGPYRDWDWDSGEETWEPFGWWEGSDLDVNIADWRIRGNRSGQAVHTAEIAWPETAEVRLRFRSPEGDSCDGEPMVVCSVDGCGLVPGASAAPQS